MIPPLAQMPRELWTWQVDVEVADLSTDEKLAAVGLGPPVPGRHGWHAYQHVGEQISAGGWRLRTLEVPTLPGSERKAGKVDIGDLSPELPAGIDRVPLPCSPSGRRSYL
jgi:hypothetical protein